MSGVSRCSGRKIQECSFDPYDFCRRLVLYLSPLSITISCPIICDSGLLACNVGERSKDINNVLSTCGAVTNQIEHMSMSSNCVHVSINMPSAEARDSEHLPSSTICQEFGASASLHTSEADTKPGEAHPGENMIGSRFIQHSSHQASYNTDSCHTHTRPCSSFHTHPHIHQVQFQNDTYCSQTYT